MTRLTPDVYVSDEVRAVRQLHADVFTDGFRQLSIRDQLARQAQRIHEAHRSGNRAVATHVTCWHPELVGHSVEQIMNHHLTLADSRETIAREYGFGGWGDADQRGTRPPDPHFEAAVDALLAGDVESLRTALRRYPSLASATSSFGHRSTLLHYVGSNGVETYRQVVPLNLAEVAQTLLDAGANVNGTAEMYGGGSTTIALLITSSHPAEAGVIDDVVRVLLDAGAEADGS